MRTSGKQRAIVRDAELAKLDELRPHPRNYRVHPLDQREHLAASMTEHGIYRNVVVSSDGVILAGHGVVEAARELGLDELPVVRLPIAHDDPRAIKLLTGDNEIGRLAEIDDRALAELLRELSADVDVDLLGTGFDDAMIANLVFVTRAEHEIGDRDDAAAWIGLPYFEGPEQPHRVVVSFETLDERDGFLELIGADQTRFVSQRNRKVWSIWWPLREREDTGALRFERPSILDRDLSEEFLDDCAAVGIDRSSMHELARAALADHRRAKTDRTMTTLAPLEERWYASLDTQPDFGIYADDAYLADLWACWLIYSRTYLRAIRQTRSLPSSGGVAADLGELTAIADVGCGIGYSTAALAELWPDARVVGTNLAGIPQTEIAIRVGQRYGFDVGGLEDAGRVDLVFASEYFEHFEQPIAHLRDVLAECDPRALLVANTFNARSPGHFERYLVDGARHDGKTTSRLFGNELRAQGFTKVETKLWNNRPAYWRR